MAGPTRRSQVAAMHKQMLDAVHSTDAERAHGDADNILTRLVTILADHERDAHVQYHARLALRAYSRVTRYCA